MSLDKINVLHILTSLGIGGIERLFVNAAPHWSRDKYNVSACLINSYARHEMVYLDDLMRYDLKVYRIGDKRRGAVDVKMPYRLSRIMKELDIHIVHTHNISSQVYVSMAGMAARIPIIVFHQHNVPTGLQLRLNPLGLFLRRPDMTVAISRHIKSVAEERLCIAGDKIRVIYNGTNVLPSEGHSGEGHTIFTVSRLAPEKGLGYLIDAMPEVIEKVPDAKLCIIGDGPARKELERRAIENGVGGVVDFPGFQQCPEIRYDKYDIFVLPSLEEGFGLALIEAMSRGKPAVATRVGGVTEIMEDGVHGILVSPADCKGLARALIRLLRDGGYRRKLALQGQRRSGQFSAKKMVAEIEDMYEGLVRRKMNMVYDTKEGCWTERGRQDHRCLCVR